MTFLFWGLATIMLIAAIGLVVVPLRSAGTPIRLVIVAVPLAASSLYFLLGSPGLQSAEAYATSSVARQSQVAGSTEQSSSGASTVADLVGGLRARLEREPDDAGGWLLLAQSYDHMGQHADALDAYERARALGKTDTSFEAKLLGKALAAEPQAVPAGPGLRGRIELSPAAMAKIKPGDTVFIFAKESLEHRMPIVALRKPASELPFVFTLTDKEIMVPGQSLKQFESLVVTARISESGNAMDNSRGLEAWSEPVSPLDGANIELLIGAQGDAHD